MTTSPRPQPTTPATREARQQRQQARAAAKAKQAAKTKKPAQAPDDAPPAAYAVEGLQGMLFLGGGNHRIEDFIFGRREPSAESFAHFADNLASRQALYAARGIRGVHLVTPDKQSVYRERYPQPGFINLSDLYRARVPQAQFLYPLAALRAMLTQHPVYYDTDTHWNETGALVACEVLLRALDLPDEAERIAHALAQTPSVKSHITGDLGSKVHPPRRSPVPSHGLKIPALVIDNGFARNQGFVSLTLNPNAPASRRLLLCGGSSMLMAKQHLAQAFGQILYIRSSHLHHEAVAMFRPTHVVTGNVERYLSRVTPDAQAPNFLLQAAVRGHVPPASHPFWLAMDGVLSPNPASLLRAVQASVLHSPAAAESGSVRNAIKAMRQAGWNLSQEVLAAVKEGAQRAKARRQATHPAGEPAP